VNFFNLANGAVGPLQIPAGTISASELNHTGMIRNLGNFLVRPGESRGLFVDCPPGSRLLGGGHEWADINGNGTSIISSGPSLEFPDKRWSVQARVDTGGTQNVIFVAALCIAA
jgi:hypothetical protein